MFGNLFMKKNDVKNLCDACFMEANSNVTGFYEIHTENLCDKHNAEHTKFMNDLYKMGDNEMFNNNLIISIWRNVPIFGAIIRNFEKKQNEKLFSIIDVRDILKECILTDSTREEVLHKFIGSDQFDMMANTAFESIDRWVKLEGTSSIKHI